MKRVTVSLEDVNRSKANEAAASGAILLHVKERMDALLKAIMNVLSDQDFSPVVATVHDLNEYLDERLDRYAVILGEAVGHKELPNEDRGAA